MSGRRATGRPFGAAAGNGADSVRFADLEPVSPRTSRAGISHENVRGPGYLPLKETTCTAPACNAQAVYCDIDHTIPYPDGPTDECNVNPKCRRHHRIKQAPGWKTTQPIPDTSTWTTPSGRTHSTGPTVYE